MATNARDQLVNGVVRPDGDRRILRFERRLAHPVDRVWAALTEPGQLSRWWGVAEELEPTEGGRVVIRWLNTDADGNPAVLHGTVTRFEPPAVLEFDTDLHGVLRFDLRADGAAATVLTFSSAIGHPAEWWPTLLAGWHLHLDYLAGTLAGERFDLARLPMDRWRALREDYQRQLS